jgi:hypothetical protein
MVRGGGGPESSTTPRTEGPSGRCARRHSRGDRASPRTRHGQTRSPEGRLSPSQSLRCSSHGWAARCPPRPRGVRAMGSPNAGAAMVTGRLDAVRRGCDHGNGVQFRDGVAVAELHGDVSERVRPGVRDRGLLVLRRGDLHRYLRRVVVTEDHHPEGGLGSAVAAALLKAGVHQLRLAHLSVSELPGSGTTAELLAAAGIDATHIASAAAALIDER